MTRRPLSPALLGWLLAAPAVLFLLGGFVLPAAQALYLGFGARTEAGVMQHGLTLDNYRRAFANDLYWRVLLRTVRMAGSAALVAMVVGYPLAWAVARGQAALSRAVTLVLVAPLLVNVVVRSYGWSAILSRTGLFAWAAVGLGLASAEEPPALLYTEWAVLIACVHVYLPFMVMPLASAIGRIDASVEEAARVAGASRVSTSSCGSSCR